MKPIQILDTTLRDGEQSAGCHLSWQAKTRVATALAELGVDIIEAGFPASSPEDFKAVRHIADTVTGPVICGLSRAHPKDIAVCTEALRGAPRFRIHTGCGISDIHILGKFRDQKYGSSLEQKRTFVLGMIRDSIAQAKEAGGEVQFYAEDAGRADADYLQEVIATAAQAGCDVFNLPDTTGWCMPAEFGELCRWVRQYLPAQVTLSVHCHNDLGLATANTLAGIAAGAEQAEVTLCGIGERAGNASLEEVVMALRVRRELHQADTGVHAANLTSTCRLAMAEMGCLVPERKAVVGSHAFAHSAGIHVDGVIKNPGTYEIFTPEMVGARRHEIILTARTGRSGLRHRLKEMGYELSSEGLETAYAKFLTIADKQGVLEETALHQLVQA